MAVIDEGNNAKLTGKDLAEYMDSQTNLKG